MRTIACVLHTGAFRNRRAVLRYRPNHVQWLQRMIQRFVKVPHRFVCLSNVDVPGVEVIPLRDNFPGWWSKIELFREFENAFYLDLDTVVVGDITEMVEYPHKFTVLQKLSTPKSGNMNSGVLAWGGDYSYIYHEFSKNPQKYIAECVTSDNWGDQGFIQGVQRKHGGWETFQELFPDRIVSHKINMKQRGNPPKGCSIVCFHGQPKPWDRKLSWVPPLKA